MIIQSLIEKLETAKNEPHSLDNDFDRCVDIIHQHYAQEKYTLEYDLETFEIKSKTWPSTNNKIEKEGVGYATVVGNPTMPQTLAPFSNDPTRFGVLVDAVAIKNLI